MKYFLSIAVAALLLGCGGDDQKTHTTTTHEAVQAVKEATTHTATQAKESVTKAATQVVEKTKEVAQEATKTVTDVANQAKEKVTQATKEATQKVATATQSINGANLFGKCAGCHGAKGEKAALGKSAVITGWSKSKVVDALKGYKAGTRNLHGMGAVMKGQASGLSEKEMEALGDYISKLH